MFLDHILAIAGLSLDTTQNLYLCVRPGVVIQGHISFDANISLFTPESDLVTRRGWIWHFHIDLVFTIPLSPRQSRAGGNTRVNIINWPLLPPHSDCSHAHTNKSYDVPENRGDLVRAGYIKFCSFNFNKFMGPWHWAILQWATKTKEFTYILNVW